jgi:type II secretory pathway pseudopilin PulG
MATIGFKNFTLANCNNKIPALIKKIFKNKKGISVVELLIVVVIISVGLVALLNAVTSSLKFSSLMKENDQAKELAQEALEAVRSFRDGTSWDAGLGVLNSDADYHPVINSCPPDCPPGCDPNCPAKWWALGLGEESIPGSVFKRKVVFSNVSRDPTSKNIESVYNPSNDDPNSRKVTATVSWDNGNKKVEISTLLTNWQ